ncbi:MAG: 3-phosphoglycerate dehydrogenase, partial [Clostridia bacterium]
MFKIQTLNSISNIIHSQLTAEKYLIANEEPVPEGILVRSADMHEMELPETLLAIARAGAGTNNIPIEECSKRGIVVFNTPGANANAVAELVICGLMLGSRNVAGGIDWATSLNGKGDEVPKLVEKGKGQFAGPEVRGKTLGVVGLGAIGAIVANAAVQGLGMEVVGYDPYISVESAWSLSRAVKRCNNMDELFAQADYITVHVPLMESTRGLLGTASIAKMKDGVHLLNFSRAELADADALKAALESGKVASYVTDFPTQAVLEMKNAVTIPHLGASTPESEENCAQMAAAELRDYLENGQIRNSVNLPEMLMGASEGTRIL